MNDVVRTHKNMGERRIHRERSSLSIKKRNERRKSQPIELNEKDLGFGVSKAFGKRPKIKNIYICIIPYKYVYVHTLYMYTIYVHTIHI